MERRQRRGCNMEIAQVHSELSDAWEVPKSKEARTEETPTTYKPPTCEDLLSSSERQSAQLPNEQEPGIDIEIKSKSRNPTAESSFSKQSTVTWSRVPPTQYPPPESKAPFSQATTATPHSDYRRSSTPPQVLLSHPTGHGIMARVSSQVATSSTNRRSRTNIRVDEYTTSENESEDESGDSWVQETTPETVHRDHG
jgi:hypothetical protein